MIPEDVVALAKAISKHYTGNEDDFLAHVSTAASFLKHARAAGWEMVSMLTGDGQKEAP